MEVLEHFKIEPYKADGIVYHVDTCLPLIDAFDRKKLKFKALARHSYPGDRLDDNTLGLNSMGYWDANEPQDWGLDWHRNEGIEFHFLESGSMPYSQEGKEVLLTPNYLTITRPWEAHKVGNPNIGMGKFYWVILDLGVRRPHQDWVWPDWITLTDTDLAELTMILRHNEKSILKADQRVRACFKRINTAINTDDNGSNASRIRLLINYLLILILDLLKTEDIVLNEALTDSSRSVEFFLKELDKNVSENWTIEKMAQSAGVGLTRFTHHCKQLTNLTPMRYLSIKRLEMAKKILEKQPELTVTEIAYMCGFATSQYFSTVFKKHEKCSPNQYKTRFLKS
ncbi:AraC family transcriptional regulator [Polaribacter reichenbachii]|uniref:AraC family transcriptional regulator n=1 Tax=Polaribacter reichenbachii TaxID=996801 RepID=A0A1B8U6L6_9FLAO|nr:AraC family transcriptional regulator [Polaribacter reichenbachii]APZ46092.1 AraC family transcriptional regulator [Polaribacter reichenbachii]AUC19954.1 AraC family transcriptional regulator [Polaribacter reichenbachii]OBY67501.1 AraC family transcriptional regulator [Polaribacter reichenbachii]